MKIFALTLVLLVYGIVIPAQSIDENTRKPSINRPDETELLLDQPEQADVSQSDVQQDFPGLGIGDFVRMILVLGFVIGLIYASFWLLKRFSGVKAEGNDVIDLIATRPLKGDSALHLVQTANRFFLIGSGSASVNLLAEIDDKESIDQLLLEAKKPVVAGGFANLIKDRFKSIQSGGKSRNTDTAQNYNQTSSDFLQQQKNRLKGL